MKLLLQIEGKTCNSDKMLKLVFLLFVPRTVFGHLFDNIKSPRVLSLFSVVSFPNDECINRLQNAANDVTGVCLTPGECSSRGGTTSAGNCASGFGVCCIFSVTQCGSTISNNITFLQNPGFPTAFATPNTPCAYTISGDSSICQIRLDFLAGTFRDTDPAAGCNTDNVAIVSPSGISPPILCGEIANQHLYIETGRQNPAAVVNVNTGAGADQRMWNIKVTMIECESPYIAPTDCLQYFTDIGGMIRSFNFPNGMIPNTNYAVCIRQRNGFCSFTLREAGSTQDDFELSANAADSAKVGTNCGAMAFIEIAGAVKNDRFCGRRLNTAENDVGVSGTVTSTTTPFRIGVVAVNAAQLAIGGFNLRYSQKPCGAF